MHPFRYVQNEQKNYKLNLKKSNISLASYSLLLFLTFQLKM